MIPADTIFVHTPCNSHITASDTNPGFCEACGRAVKRDEIREVDSCPGPFAGQSEVSWLWCGGRDLNPRTPKG